MDYGARLFFLLSLTSIHNVGAFAIAADDLVVNLVWSAESGCDSALPLRFHYVTVDGNTYPKDGMCFFPFEPLMFSI